MNCNTLIMDVSMQLVQRQCGRYFNSYANCVNSFPNTWHLDCNNQKIKLATCAESEPTIMQIKTKCAVQFERYESCVVANPTRSEQCHSQFEEFNKCAEKVAPSQDKNAESSSS